MELSAEAIKLIQDTAEKAAAVQVATIPGDPVRVIVSQAGQHKFEELPPPPRKHTVASLSQVVGAVQRFGQGGENDDTAPTIWHNVAAVVAILEDERRADRVSLALAFSPQFSKLLQLQQENEFDQVEFVRLLRHDFAGCVKPELVPLFRRITFNRRNDGTADLQHGRESLGRSVEAAVTASEDIPEQIAVKCRVYETQGCEWAVTVVCTVDIDTQLAQFSLTPLPGELTIALQAVQEKIGAYLRDALEDNAKIEVFYGSPE